MTVHSSADSDAPRSRRIDGSAGLLGIVYGLVEANTLGWGSLQVLGSFAAGLGLLAGFVAWEARAAEPVLPLRFFRNPGFAATNAVSLIMYFGIFG